MKWLARIALLLAIVALPLYSWFITTSEGPEGAWPIDMVEVRMLAQSLPGDLPTDVRVEQVASFAVPAQAIVAGAGWQNRGMAIYAYQLVFPHGTGVIDTGITETQAKNDMRSTDWNGAAFKRIQDAVVNSGFTVLTHEHADHLSGLSTHPDPEKAFAHALLTPEQIANRKGQAPHPLSDRAISLVKPLSYDTYTALAPGGVLIKMPGHSLGSQLVYVKRFDGIELLFLGDVAWQMRNVDEVRERPRLVTLILNEDRAKVLQQLQTLNDLKKSDPALVQIPGHDPEVVEALIAKGVLHKEFVTAAKEPAPTGGASP